MLTIGADRLAPAIFEPVLDRLRAECVECFSAANVRLLPIAYEERPFSFLLRAGVCRNGGVTPGSHVFIKIFKERPSDVESQMMLARVARDFETTRRIYDAMSHHETLGAVRPIVCYPEHLATVTEQTEGPTLLAHLERYARWWPARSTLDDLAGTLSNVGRWVSAFQAIDDLGTRVSIAALRSYVDLRLERLVRQVPSRFTEEYRRRVGDHIDRLGSEVPPGDLREVLVHADLAPANVLISDARVVVLDFAMSNRGSMFHDLSRLFVQLDLLRMKPQFRPGVIRHLQRALLHGFDPALAPDRPLFRLSLLVHRINHFGTLSLGREAFPASVYNWNVRRAHRRWIESELQSIAGEPR